MTCRQLAAIAIINLVSPPRHHGSRPEHITTRAPPLPALPIRLNGFAWLGMGTGFLPQPSSVSTNPHSIPFKTAMERLVENDRCYVSLGSNVKLGHAHTLSIAMYLSIQILIHPVVLILLYSCYCFHLSYLFCYIHPAILSVVLFFVFILLYSSYRIHSVLFHCILSVVFILLYYSIIFIQFVIIYP